MDQFAAVARQLAAEFTETAERLIVRIALELQDHGFVAKVFQLLENQ